MEKIEVKEAKGKLGILVVGVGGAVATTMITGTLAARKGLAKPIGSISQLATMRLENGEEKAIKDIVPLTDLNDIVFGGWDIFPDNAYEAAMYAEVLKEKDLNDVKDELEAIKPMPAAFDHNWAKRLNGTHIKQAATVGIWLNSFAKISVNSRLPTIASASPSCGLQVQKSIFRYLTSICLLPLWKKQ